MDSVNYLTSNRILSTLLDHIAMQTMLITLLRFYKIAISPLFCNRCRFYPSCSDYAYKAIQYHGVACGIYFAVKRLCRCHPFSVGGIDLVPLPAPLKSAEMPRHQD